MTATKLKIELTEDAILEVISLYEEVCEENDGVAYSVADRVVFEALIRSGRMKRDSRDVNAAY